MGQPIYAFFVGNKRAKNRILVTGGMHAREWITTLAVSELVKIYAERYRNGEFDGYIAFIPLVNPDGVGLAVDGLTGFCGREKFLLSVNSGNHDFSLWKANANAVDINVNFDANWGGGVSNVFSPAPANFIGSYPESEPETKALVKFVYEFCPTASLAFHSKGEIIYYGFEELPPEQIEHEYEIARELSHITGYVPIQSVGSAGGLSDWAALKTGAPSFTIEVGNENLPHPITQEELPVITEQIKDIIMPFLKRRNLSCCK